MLSESLSGTAVAMREDALHRQNPSHLISLPAGQGHCKPQQAGVCFRRTALHELLQSP